MAKPANQPRWADLATDPAQRTAPPGALANVGWAVADRPAAQHLNWLFFTIYSWLLYLSALLGGSGVSENLKAAGIDGTGNSTIAGTLGVTGATTLASVGVTGNETVGGTFGVTGAATVGGTLTVTGNIAGTATFTNAPSAPFYHTTTAQATYIPASAGNAGHGGQAGDFDMSTGVVFGATTIFDWVVPITATPGETMAIHGEFQMTNAVSGGSVNLLFVDRITGVASVVGTGAIASSVAVQSVSVVTGHAVLFGYYSLQFNFAGGHGGVKVFGVEKLWTR
jgi:ethanolamine utilization microcompartment shell protein EutS